MANPCKVEMVAIADLKADPDNPRRPDPARLDLVELSLSRLGWLLPIYITDDGEILSGHQRTTVAARMGATHVPCVRVKMTEKRRTGINVIFNRATNDMGKEDSGGAMAAELSGSIVIASAQHLPQLDPADFDAWCPVLRAELRDTADVLAATGEWNNDRHSVSGASTLARNGVHMPIVVSDTGAIINGWGRLVRAAEAGDKQIAVVECPADRADLANLLLNRLSMDFALEDRYADILRFNSFRRARGREKVLNRTMVAYLYKLALHAKGSRRYNTQAFTPLGRLCARSFRFSEKEVELWRRAHGDCVVDFGAGLADKTELLLNMGIDAIPFEPYWIGGSDSGFALDEGREMGRRFLERIARGDRFDTIFLAAILNSVPFRRDRELIVAICAALCYGHPKAQVVAGVNSAAVFDKYMKKNVSAARGSGDGRFALTYEPGVTVADLEKVPKMQKFHTLPEWRILWGTQFAKVDAWDTGEAFLVAHCTRPLKPDPAVLAEALAFEFELPFPDGVRYGLGAEAFAAFEQRLGIKLPRKYLTQVKKA